MSNRTQTELATIILFTVRNAFYMKWKFHIKIILSTASDDEVEDLGIPVEFDHATSKIFVSDDHVSGAGLSWPAAEQMRSMLVNEEVLQMMCDQYRVPKVYKPRCAGQSGPCNKPSGGTSNAICVYLDAFEAGMTLHDFYTLLLRHYNVAPSQLAPNSWSYMAGFVQLCKDAGADPLVPVFRYFFSICRRKDDSLGWFHFSPRPVSPYTDGSRCRLFTGTLPVRSGWKARFFFLDGDVVAAPVHVGEAKESGCSQDNGPDHVEDRLQRELQAANAKLAEQAVIITELQGQLQGAKDFSAKFIKEARLEAEHAAEIAKLRKENAADVAKLAKEVLLDAKKDVVLKLFPNLDPSLLK